MGNPRLQMVSTNSGMWGRQGPIQHAGTPLSPHTSLSSMLPPPPDPCIWVRGYRHILQLHPGFCILPPSYIKSMSLSHVYYWLEETLSPLLSTRDSANQGYLRIFYLIKRAKCKTSWQTEIPHGLKQGHGEVNVRKWFLPGSCMYQ